LKVERWTFAFFTMTVVTFVREIPKPEMKNGITTGPGSESALAGFPILRRRSYHTKSIKSTGDYGNEIAKQELDFVICHSSLPAMASVLAMREIPNQK
jgi:hypothetical protein